MLASTPWNKTHFYEVSKPWRDLGYTVIPSNGPGIKLPLERQSYSRWCGEGREPVSEHQWMEWCSRYGDHEGLLLLDSSTGDLPDLAVLDVDDMSLYDWAVEHLHSSPYYVRSGRQGGGMHLYGRLLPGQVQTQAIGRHGPTAAWHQDARGRWSTQLDIKSQRNYVVAPGSRHQSGLIYGGTLEVTRAGILSLPVWDVTRVEALRGVGCPNEGGESTGMGPGSRPGPAGARYARETRSWDVALPPPHSGTLEALARTVPDGRSIRVGCPFHESDSGRSAVLLHRHHRLRLVCHVCGVTYAPASDPWGGAAWAASVASEVLSEGRAPSSPPPLPAPAARVVAPHRTALQWAQERLVQRAAERAQQDYLARMNGDDLMAAILEA